VKICIACDGNREKYASDHGIFRLKILRAAKARPALPVLSFIRFPADSHRKWLIIYRNFNRPCVRPGRDGRKNQGKEGQAGRARAVRRACATCFGYGLGRR
jgi:hypothetical protein